MALAPQVLAASPRGSNRLCGWALGHNPEHLRLHHPHKAHPAPLPPPGLAPGTMPAPCCPSPALLLITVTLRAPVTPCRTGQHTHSWRAQFLSSLHAPQPTCVQRVTSHVSAALAALHLPERPPNLRFLAPQPTSVHVKPRIKCMCQSTRYTARPQLPTVKHRGCLGIPQTFVVAPRMRAGPPLSVACFLPVILAARHHTTAKSTCP